MDYTASDWSSVVTWPGYWPLIGHQMDHTASSEHPTVQTILKSITACHSHSRNSESDEKEIPFGIFSCLWLWWRRGTPGGTGGHWVSMSDLRHNILGDVIQQSGCQPSRLSRLTWVLREADWERRLSDLLLEEILLVEEEDDGGVHEPLVVADGVEQFHALVHPESNKTVIRSEIWRLEVTRASYGLTLISLSFRAEHHMVWWPIRGQHPGHVITLDQSERSITWSDGGDNTWEDKWFLREIGSSEHPSLEVYLQTDVMKINITCLDFI